MIKFKTLTTSTVDTLTAVSSPNFMSNGLADRLALGLPNFPVAYYRDIFKDPDLGAEFLESLLCFYGKCL